MAIHLWELKQSNIWEKKNWKGISFAIDKTSWIKKYEIVAWKRKCGGQKRKHDLQALYGLLKAFMNMMQNIATLNKLISFTWKEWNKSHINTYVDRTIYK